MTSNEKVLTEIEDLKIKITELKATMDSEFTGLKHIIRFAMNNFQGSGATKSPEIDESKNLLADKEKNLKAVQVLMMMTSKQHAAMQMWLFSGMNMADMARRMSCSRNTARLHLKALWTKMGTDDKDIISQRLLPILEAASDTQYSEWSKGLPKNWAAAYDAGSIDPFLSLYVKSKRDTYDRSKVGSEVEAETESGA